MEEHLQIDDKQGQVPACGWLLPTSQNSARFKKKVCEGPCGVSERGGVREEPQIFEVRIVLKDCDFSFCYSVLQEAQGLEKAKSNKWPRRV